MSLDVLAFVLILVLVGAVLAWLHFAWFIFWVGFAIWLGLVELYLEIKAGRTLSEIFGENLRRRPAVAYVALATLTLFAATLIAHLLAMK